MILQAAKEFDIDLAGSIMVGDKKSDMQAGVAAGVGCNLMYSTKLVDVVDENLSTEKIKNLVHALDYLSR
jgi:D-glycero-D-manno-heptose 1,7-bisphosphate phosphatase